MLDSGTGTGRPEGSPLEASPPTDGSGLIDPSQFLVKDGDLKTSKINEAADTLRTIGDDLSAAVATVDTSWGDIQMYYESPEQGRVYTVMDPAVDEADDTRDSLIVAEGVLDDFAGDLLRIVPALSDVTVAATEFREEALAGYDEFVGNGPADYAHGMEIQSHVGQVYPAGQLPPGVSPDQVRRIGWQEYRTAFNRNEELVRQYSDVFAEIMNVSSTCAERLAGCMRHSEGMGADLPEVSGRDLAQVWGTAVEVRDPNDQIFDFFYNSIADGAALVGKDMHDTGVEGWELTGQAWGGLVDSLGSPLFVTAFAPVVAANSYVRGTDVKLTGAGGGISDWITDRENSTKGLVGSFIGWDHQEYLAGGDGFHKWSQGNRVETGAEVLSVFAGGLGVVRGLVGKGARAGVRAGTDTGDRSLAVAEGAPPESVTPGSVRADTPSLADQQISMSTNVLASESQHQMSGGDVAVHVADPEAGSTRLDGSGAVSSPSVSSSSGVAAPVASSVSTHTESGVGGPSGGPAGEASAGVSSATPPVFVSGTQAQAVMSTGGRTSVPVPYDPEGHLIKSPSPDQLEQALGNAARYSGDGGSFVVDPRTGRPLREFTQAVNQTRGWLVHQNRDGTLVAVNPGQGHGGWTPMGQVNGNEVAVVPGSRTSDVDDAAWANVPRDARGNALDPRDGSVLPVDGVGTVVVQDLKTGEYYIAHDGPPWESEAVRFENEESVLYYADEYDSKSRTAPGTIDQAAELHHVFDPATGTPGYKEIAHSRNAQWAEYQSQISGIDRTDSGGLMEYHRVSDKGELVRFDGHTVRGEPPQEVFLEAKHGYVGEWNDATGRPTGRRAEDWEKQVKAQLDALPEGAKLEWHFSSPQGAAAARQILGEIKDHRLDIRFTPFTGS